jgi:hypothetical protein
VFRFGGVVMLRHVGRDLVVDLNSIISHRLHQLGRRLRRLFKRKNEPFYEPDTQRLAELMSQVVGASWCWCGGCGELLAPVVVGDDDCTRVVALGCRTCGPRSGIPVRAGLLMGGEPSATAH